MQGDLERLVDQDNRNLVKFNKEKRKILLWTSRALSSISWGWICLARSSSGGRFLGQRMERPDSTKATLWVLQRRSGTRRSRRGLTSELFRPHSDAASSLGLHSAGKTSAAWSVVRGVLREVGAGQAALGGEAPGGVGQPWACRLHGTQSSPLVCREGEERARLCGVKDNRHKVKQERFTLGMWRNLFPMRAVEP